MKGARRRANRYRADEPSDRLAAAPGIKYAVGVGHSASTCAARKIKEEML
jgi:hypothetical protein